MRSIEIDTDVFAAIWVARQLGETSENEILRRILLVNNAKKFHVEPEQPKEDKSFEAKSSLNGAIFETNEEVNDMGKIRWVDDVRAALYSLGGSASLHNIYREVKNRRRAAGRSLPRTLEAVIRRTIEDHSSDSANYKGIDYFRLIGRGEWSLRK